MCILDETIPLKTNCASKERLNKMTGWPDVHFVYVRIELGKSRGFPNLLKKKIYQNIFFLLCTGIVLTRMELLSFIHLEDRAV
jgi:hypothetical protein